MKKLLLLCKVPRIG